MGVNPSAELPPPGARHVMPSPDNPEISRRDAAELCGVAERTLERDHEQGKLDMVKRGRSWFTTIDALERAGRYRREPDATPEDQLDRSRQAALIRSLQDQLAAAVKECEFLARELVEVREHAAAIREADLARIADLRLMLDVLRGAESRTAA